VLKIATAYDSVQHSIHSGSIRSALRQILPPQFILEERREDFKVLLPIVKWSEWGEAPRRFSLFLLSRYRPNGSQFFYDMISRWLVPGKQLNISLFFATDFKFLEWDEERYALSEMVICLDLEQDVETASRNLPFLAEEIRLGITSVYHASRILEIKGLSMDEKTALIQERIASLVQLRPSDFDYDIFDQMQHFFVTCRPEFKAVRKCQQLTRIITYFYLFRRFLRRLVETSPEKRHVSLKVHRICLHLPLGMKEVLGIYVAMNFLKEHEVFDQQHLMHAVRNYLPDARLVEDSFVTGERKEDQICLVYLEVEKEGGGSFLSEEIKRLRLALPADLESRVEHLVRPLFMPRNEEEVMRHIVTLSHQLKFNRDIPQVIIGFDEQRDAELIFTVIFVRILQPDSASVQKLFEQARSSAQVVVDRIKGVGMIRKKYPKEATVFRLKVPSLPFLRKDQSVDLYRARQSVVAELQRVLGEVRDYNGGMIAKQIEAFLALKEALGDLARRQEFLLENFFHSIFPVEMRSVLRPDPLKTLFLLLLARIEGGASDFQVREESGQFFVLIGIQDLALIKEIFNAVDLLQIPPSQLVKVQLKAEGIVYLGYIYFCDEQDKKNQFLGSLEEFLTSVR
jgi:hypothetical protein